ncbi:MAG: hypothetical protein GY845_08725 [Planctomycetes bacterium]|nr:hypothetical protein [Planctomycetota bacterium]
MLPKPVKKRNILFCAGIIMLIIAVILKPSLLLFFLTSEDRVHVFLVVLASLCIAIGFHELANGLLKNNGLPWYTRPGGFIVLILLTTLFCIMAAFIDGLILPTLGIGPIVKEQAHRYELFGMVILWIISLEWVTCK